MGQEANDLERMWQFSHVTIEQAADIIFWVDSEARIYRANEAACSLLGYEREELLSKRITDLGVDSEAYREDWRKVKEAKSLLFESVFRRRDGSTFPVELKGNFVEFQGDEYCCAIVHDISERKRREQELNSAYDELEKLKSRLEAENVYLQEEIKVDHNFGEIVAQSRAFKKVLRQLEQVAPTDSTVLILGETGTGKELLARAVHDHSRRKDRPLVKVNCAALPANLIESELFGHEKGAFTGAIARKIGRFELADGGTIFLDEIGDLPLELQAKLLRVLQEGELERVGGLRTLKVDVRVIAATNRDLEKAMAEGNFREDLYYRLNVFPVKSPPLRERREDIPALVNHFVHKYAPKMGKKIDTVPQKVMDSLLAYYWPGNVRELENIIERSLIVSRGKTLTVEDCFRQPVRTKEKGKVTTLVEMEREYILQVLEMTGWRVSGEKGAAELLGLRPTTLEARMKKMGIERKGK